jgi:hypothetical protein
MSELRTETGFADADAAYGALVDALRGLSEAESAALNARLVVILANHIGDLGVLKAAIALARKGS